MESSENLPIEEEEEDIEMTDVRDQKAEKIDSDKKSTKKISQHPDG